MSISAELSLLVHETTELEQRLGRIEMCARWLVKAIEETNSGQIIRAFPEVGRLADQLKDALHGHGLPKA